MYPFGSSAQNEMVKNSGGGGGGGGGAGVWRGFVWFGGLFKQREGLRLYIVEGDLCLKEAEVINTWNPPKAARLGQWAPLRGRVTPPQLPEWRPRLKPPHPHPTQVTRHRDDVNNTTNAFF